MLQTQGAARVRLTSFTPQCTLDKYAALLDTFATDLDKSIAKHDRCMASLAKRGRAVAEAVEEHATKVLERGYFWRHLSLLLP